MPYPRNVPSHGKCHPPARRGIWRWLVAAKYIGLWAKSLVFFFLRDNGNDGQTFSWADDYNSEIPQWRPRLCLFCWRVTEGVSGNIKSLIFRFLSEQKCLTICTFDTAVLQKSLSQLWTKSKHAVCLVKFVFDTKVWSLSVSPSNSPSLFSIHAWLKAWNVSRIAFIWSPFPWAIVMCDEALPEATYRTLKMYLRPTTNLSPS